MKVRINKKRNRVYIKCKKCKKDYTIDSFSDRLEWWKKYGKHFVCLLCDPDVKWHKKLDKH